MLVSRNTVDNEKTVWTVEVLSVNAIDHFIFLLYLFTSSLYIYFHCNRSLKLIIDSIVHQCLCSLTYFSTELNFQFSFNLLL